MSINWSISNAPRAAWFLLKLHVQGMLDKQFKRKTRDIKVLEYVRKNTEPGNPAAVLAAMDQFARNDTWLMNIGPAKGEVLMEALRSSAARKVLEIGAFCGYSATLIGEFLQTSGGHLTSIEKSGRLAWVARQVIEHAGLNNFVDVRKGILATEIDSFNEPFDAVLLDHWKDEYLPDLHRLENAGLLKPGTVVVADNVGFFSVPDYLDYVRQSPRYDTKFIESTVEYNENLKDGVEVSVFRG
ncbi:MAG: class I SAM-dependent methyltransferase [Xanthomonadales bacterium]|nr:class I SAM-dependent methyltransferase [Xanthomonadales bacterium]